MAFEGVYKRWGDRIPKDAIALYPIELTLFPHEQTLLRHEYKLLPDGVTVVLDSATHFPFVIALYANAVVMLPVSAAVLSDASVYLLLLVTVLPCELMLL